MESQEKREMIIDSSLSSFDESISPEEYKERLLHILPSILQRRFPEHYAKQRVRPYRDRINIACPYCGDSMKNPHAKRGNIILAGKFTNFYKCHNCDEFKRVDKFLKDFEVNLELDVVNYISENQGNFSTSSHSNYDITLLLDVDLIDQYAIDRQELISKFKLMEINESSVWSWLKSRLQFQQERFLYNQEQNYLAILNLTPTGKVIGFQKRWFNLKPGDSKYTTHTLSKIYEILGIQEEIPDEVDAVSQLFGIFQVNFNIPITLFEGPLDSFLFKNSVANAGASKTFPFAVPLRYWFDSDPKGTEKAIEYIEHGRPVFLWERLKRDYELPYRKKWDLNDVLIYFKEKGITFKGFDQYFSDDPFDILDI